MFSSPYGHCHSRVKCSLWSMSLQSVHFSLWSLSLCSLPLLCSGNEHPWSPYSLTSKRCSSQSLLPFQHSAVPKILQWMSTAIKPQPSLHPKCSFLCPKLSQTFCRHSIIFTGTSKDLSTHIYKMLYNVPLYVSSPVQCCQPTQAPVLNIQLSKFLISYLQTRV
jgi:hypothetical protein